ncbi:MAG: HypC/HybG/HupF family hydrogenase formation chaperone [Acidobacteriota bacterium]
MCLAIPMRLVEKDGWEGTVELNGVRRSVSLMLLEDAGVGDHVLIHAGYAIGKVDEEEARLTLEGLERIAASLESGGG